MVQPTIVILLSDKRSGSTLLEQELCKHSQINHVSFTPHSYNETHYWLNAACILKTPTQLFCDGVRPKSYGSEKSAKSLLINLINSNVPDFELSDENSKLINQGWNALCEQYAKPIFFEKSPQHIHHWAALDLILQWIKQTPFKVKVIGLVRNPMAVMYSAKNIFHTKPEQRQFGWAQGYRNLLAVQNILTTEQYKLVRYEDLIQNPYEELNDLCSFIGIDHEQNMGKETHMNSQNIWQEAADFNLQLHPSVKLIAQNFGYAEEQLCNSNKTVQYRLIDDANTLYHRFCMQSYNKTKRFLRRFNK